MALNRYIPQGDYTYENDQDIHSLLRINRSHPQRVTFSVDEQFLQQLVLLLNMHKIEISDLLVRHDAHLLSLSSNDAQAIRLYTDPNFCGFINAVLRGNAQPEHIETTVAFITEFINSNFNHAGLIAQNIQAVAQQHVNVIRNIDPNDLQRRVEVLTEMIHWIYRNYIFHITNLIASAPPLVDDTDQFLNFFIVFRGVFGPTAIPYMNLQVDDFYIEHGFLSTTWMLAKAIRYATQTLQPNRHVVVIRIASEVKCLSVHSISLNPDDREILFPAGTIFKKLPDGQFDVVGCNQRFIINDPAVPGVSYDINNYNAIQNINQYYDITDQLPHMASLYFGAASTQVMPRAHSAQMPRRYKSSVRMPRRYKSSARSRRRSRSGINGVHVYNDGTVDFDMHILQRTHNIVTIVNEKGELVTFFYKK